ncbi:NAD(P)-dependent alcohol dehydrogenase [Streptomyces halobius]|uniref:NAD(P)-dependent alcohol dehydrogenase n=1 Tax=Streptomyces halobius TaxID=2879846 RepID=A0ABY4LZU2_9ACTN|nr:NAD(P)-dependent alcohol dehydrogenase [Streptomyces halobius]UQA90707.1 NAD(P)-dependent alcohol dehydrogenase [Streptomyces halobius]
MTAHALPAHIPPTMRAAVLTAPETLEIQERPVPRPGPGQVLVRVEAVGICGSDVHYYRHGRIGDFVVRAPMILGHEPGGTVAALGPDTSRHQVGQRVSVEPGVPCARCAQCRRGRYNLCPDVSFHATPPVDGALCEYIAADEDFAHPVPDKLTAEEAALLEPLSVGVWACRKGRVGPGSRVLVTGAGPIGLVAAQTARAFGATEVVVTDVAPHRLDLARQLGATATVDVGGGTPLPQALDAVRAGETPIADTDFEPDVLLECSGVPAVVGEAIRTVGRAGRAVLVGMGGDTVPLPLAHVQNFEIEVTGTFRYANTWPTAIALAASGEVDLDRLITHRYDLEAAEDALTAAARDRTTVKPLVLPQPA